MSDASMGDDVYQPDAAEDEQDDVGILEPADTLVHRGVDEALDEGYSPPERPMGVEHYGVTADEQRRGESLDQRLAEEVPDENTAVGYGGTGGATEPEAAEGAEGEAQNQKEDPRSSRLLSPGEGTHEEHGGMVGTDAGIDGSAASAEEAAMHTTDDPT